MKKATSNTHESPVFPPVDSSRFLTNTHRHPQDLPVPVSQVFTILPNIDTQSLLCHASETLASLNVMSSDLAGELQGSHRSVALALQQLTELGGLLVNRALENLEPPAAFTPPTQNV